MTRISLIMPVYNAEKTIDYSVDSVFKQTEDDFEFIAVNDGSIDDSLKKLEELKSICVKQMLFLLYIKCIYDIIKLK